MNDFRQYKGIDYSIYLSHYGVGHDKGGHSGRYPWGSGDRPRQSTEGSNKKRVRLGGSGSIRERKKGNNALATAAVIGTMAAVIGGAYVYSKHGDKVRKLLSQVEKNISDSKKKAEGRKALNNFIKSASLEDIDNRLDEIENEIDDALKMYRSGEKSGSIIYDKMTESEKKAGSIIHDKMIESEILMKAAREKTKALNKEDFEKEVKRLTEKMNKKYGNFANEDKESRKKEQEEKVTERSDKKTDQLKDMMSIMRASLKVTNDTRKRNKKIKDKT